MIILIFQNNYPKNYSLADVKLETNRQISNKLEKIARARLVR